MKGYRESDELSPQPPDSTPDFAALRAKRKKRTLTLVVPAVAVLGSALAFGLWFARRTAQQQLAEARGKMQACLFEGQLEANETPAVRFRRNQLTVLGIPEGERLAAGATAWPLVCAADVRATLAAAGNAGVDPAASAPLAELAARLDDPASLSLDLSAVLDKALAVAPSVASAPAPAHFQQPSAWPLSTADLGDDFRVANQGVLLGHAFTENNPSQTLPILIDEKDLPESPLLCSFTASESEGSCRPLSGLAAVRAQGMRLLGTSDPGAAPLVFAGRRGEAGIFTSTGESIDRLYSYGGYVDRAGNVSVLGFDTEDRKLVLVRKPAGKESSRLVLEPKFKVGNYFYSAQILWDQLLVRGVKDNQRRLFVLPLATADEQGFAPADVGELPEAGQVDAGDGQEQQHIDGCRTGEMTVVRVRGWDNDFLAFRFGEGTFSTPLWTSAAGTLGCHGSVANVVSVRHDRSPLLRHSVCTSSGCVMTAFTKDKLDRNSEALKLKDHDKIAAVDLMGKLLVVWSAGENAGLRMRMATPDSFERAADKVLFDDHWHDGRYEPASTLLGFRLFSRENAALLLMSTTRGLHALRITPDGNVTPWKVRHH